MCCGGSDFAYYPVASEPICAVGPITSFDCCPCKYDPPFSRLATSCGPYVGRPICWCEDWSTPCVSYQSSKNYHYLPSPLSGPRSKKIYFCNENMIPGYSGHIPGFKYHAAARTFGNATRDTGIIFSQRQAPCLCLPNRIWEQ